ncbi:MAG: hypothetical protein JST00_46780 [Deltaproteobacteria bacterium]|nr:hypothetical protein [Deltaproteobacteria bacterium]
MTSERVHVTLTELEERWSCEDAQDAHDVLDALEAAEAEAYREAERRRMR